MHGNGSAVERGGQDRDIGRQATGSDLRAY